ncbi:MAG: hypothetical protein L0216_03880 [Planctomycetales bacterium]|nr:hypothetical protein [Planctomycetales bacterium]
MPHPEEMLAILAEICRKDPRFRREAYPFVFEALSVAQKLFKKDEAPPEDRHVTGPQLLEGVKELAGRKFGFLAKTVLNEWGIRRTEDVGEIVFNLIEAGLMGRQESDSRGDFAAGYDFEEAFEREFRLPRSSPPEKSQEEE